MIFSNEFLKQVPLEWADILWGYSNRLIGWRTPGQIASQREIKTPLEAELVKLSKDQDWRVREILEELAALHPVEEAISKGKWLYVSLLWLYENRDEVEDVYEKLAILHAEFDYPEDIGYFMPYMQSQDGYDPSKHSAGENRARIYTHWKLYLDRTGSTLR